MITGTIEINRWLAVWAILRLDGALVEQRPFENQKSGVTWLISEGVPEEEIREKRVPAR